MAPKDEGVESLLRVEVASVRTRVDAMCRETGSGRMGKLFTVLHGPWRVSELGRSVSEGRSAR